MKGKKYAISGFILGIIILLAIIFGGGFDFTTGVTMSEFAIAYGSLVGAITGLVWFFSRIKNSYILNGHEGLFLGSLASTYSIGVFVLINPFS